MTCMKTGSDESFIIMRDKGTRQCPQTTTFEEKGEPKHKFVPERKGKVKSSGPSPVRDPNKQSPVRDTTVSGVSSVLCIRRALPAFSEGSDQRKR